MIIMRKYVWLKLVNHSALKIVAMIIICNVVIQLMHMDVQGLKDCWQ